MKAMCVVAHPDDCIIFAYSFMHQYKELDWTVCYLTYTEQDVRGKEFAEFWQRRNVKTQFLGFVDNWHDIENCKISFDETQARLDIARAIFNQDIVISHDINGDYGHIHHKFVHDCVRHHPALVTFAAPGKGNARFVIGPGIYELSEIPEHKDIVASFHTTEHVNEYLISENVEHNILEEYLFTKLH